MFWIDIRLQLLDSSSSQVKAAWDTKLEGSDTIEEDITSW
jgi:hypothetical protein